MKGIEDWYIKKYYTYVKIFKATGTPHMLPKYVLDKLLVREIVYRTIENGVITYLSEKNKRHWPIFPLHIGMFSLQNKRQTKKEDETLIELCLCVGESKSHDPRSVVYEHMRAVKLAPQTVHESNFPEDIFRDALSFEEDVERLTIEIARERLRKEED